MTHIRLTVTAHPDGDALFQPAILAAVPVDAEDGALLVLCAGPVLDLLLDAAPEEALRTEFFLFRDFVRTAGGFRGERLGGAVRPGHRHTKDMFVYSEGDDVHAPRNSTEH